MANIYDINTFPTSEAEYKKHEIVKITASSDPIVYPAMADQVKPAPQNNTYYYALNDHSSSTAPHSNTVNWGGYKTDTNGLYWPYFLWTPSYPVQANQAPRMRSIKFGDGYEQRTQDGINNSLLTLALSFSLRDADEGKAILHFLESRLGTEPFLFLPPDPYSKQKLFVCKSWASNFNFFDNYDVTATFEETPL